MSQLHQTTVEPESPIQIQGSFRTFIQHYEISFFFILTFIFSWSIWFIIPYLPNTHDWGRVRLIAAAGPAIAAILLGRILQPAHDLSLAKRYRVIFTVVFITTAGIIWLDSLWWSYPLTKVEIILDFVLAILTAYIFSGAFSPRQGIRSLLGHLAKWCGGIHLILVAFLLWPVIVIVSNQTAHLLGISVPTNPGYPEIPLIPLIIESFLWVLLIGGPINEEIGWRGFALPRLQRRTTPLMASIWIGIAWGAWHFPLHLLGMYPFGAAGFLIRLQEVPSAIIFTWLFNRSKGSLLPVILLHVARNTTSIFFSRAYIPVFTLWFLLAIVLVVWDKMWKPLPVQNSVTT